MKVIENAFREALESKENRPRKGWWGYTDGNTHYIMRYGHLIMTFDRESAKIYECCTRSDKRGINNALELIKDWVLNDFKLNDK